MFDNTNPADLTALNTEVFTDPISMGYAGAPISVTSALLELINTPADNAVPEMIFYPDMSSDDARSVTLYDAYDGLLDPEQLWLNWMTGNSSDGGRNMPLTDELKLKLAGIPTANDAIWAVSDRDEMNARMRAIMERPASRAEALWGFGTIITETDWFLARDEG